VEFDSPPGRAVSHNHIEKGNVMDVSNFEYFDQLVTSYDFMPRISIYEADLRDRQAHAIARYETGKIYFNSYTIGNFSTYGKNWLISHEYGHHVMQYMLDAGISFDCFKVFEDMLPARLINKLDGLSNGDLVLRVYEAFAEAFAFMSMDVVDRRFCSISMAIDRLVFMLDYV
jgi:hypothetical protein